MGEWLMLQNILGYFSHLTDFGQLINHRNSNTCLKLLNLSHESIKTHFCTGYFPFAGFQGEAAYGAGGEAAGPYARYELGKDSENKMRHADIDGNMVELNDPKYYEKHILLLKI
ncbi:MAG: hypothetical protein IPH94_21530 [Saprospiraceae bacterium]|nr:hypothetical protein [Saprospiraceae bacterium]